MAPLPPLLPGEPWLRALLSRCSSHAHLAQAHASLLRRGLDQSSPHLFLSACTALGLPLYALSVFSLSPHPHPLSFPLALKAAASLSDRHVTPQLHCHVILSGLSPDLHVSSALLLAYSSSSLPSALQLFDEIPHPDPVCWNTITAAHARRGYMDRAQSLFDRMPRPNVVSWTTLISGYARSGAPAAALAAFRHMQAQPGLRPDTVSVLAAVSACAKLGDLRSGICLHRYALRGELFRSVPLTNALIDMYAKCGSVTTAMEVFEAMPERSVVTWTTMIAGLARHGLGEEAVAVFERMEREGPAPNSVTRLAVLAGCSHGGLVEAGRRVFEATTAPTVEHYGCMVDVLSRAGLLREARELIEGMPFEGNAAVWGSLLAGARSGGDEELGAFALGKLTEVEPENCGNYSLMSDIYAGQGRWGQVGMMRKMIRDGGLRKTPGGSSVEVDGLVYEFTSRCSSHPELEGIMNTLAHLSAHLKEMVMGDAQFFS
ncbi:pentatricopeptide repeat (PPR) superfamily protein [Wolffia australiana]